MHVLLEKRQKNRCFSSFSSKNRKDSIRNRTEEEFLWKSIPISKGNEARIAFLSLEIEKEDSFFMKNNRISKVNAISFGISGKEFTPARVSNKEDEILYESESKEILHACARNRRNIIFFTRFRSDLER